MYEIHSTVPSTGGYYSAIPFMCIKTEMETRILVYLSGCGMSPELL